MSDLEFGVFDVTAIVDDDENPEATAQGYEDHIRDAQLAERSGYTYFFFIEHQNAGFPCISTPAVYLAALARATTTIRIGTMIFMLPLHHPIRLAQDAAVVDVLSRGRLDFGIGTGSRAGEFAPWHVDYRDRRPQADEVMEIVIKTWTERTFSHTGKFWSFTNAGPQPRPFQRPHPPVWVGAHSPSSYEYAADHGYNVSQIFEAETPTAAKFAHFRAYWRKTGRPVAAPRTALVRHVHVAESDAAARAQAEPYMLRGIQGPGIVERSLKIRAAADATPDALELARVYIETSRSMRFWFDEGLAFVGSPETVAAAIRAQRDRVGYDVLLLNHQFVDMPRDLYAKSMQLFGERVIPGFRT